MIKLNYSVTADLSGFKFYVEAGGQFDALDYAEAYGLNVHDLDPDSVHWAQDAAARLMGGEWLLVEHDIPADE